MSSLAEASAKPPWEQARKSDPVAPTERPPPPPSSGESDVLLGQTLDGRYRIEARIGEGGLGSVYRAHHVKLERSVAVKVLRAELRSVPEIRQRFEREVRTLSSLSHPNIVTITDYGDQHGMPYLVMELAEGQELNVLARAGLEPRRALDITRQILSSLAYAHARDVVHRDLKPANVIVGALPDGRDHVVVLDFGLAKFIGDDGTSGHDLTRSGLVVGTPAYLPPEQLGGGSKKADARSDLYAVGLIMFEMLTGRRPFLGEDAADVLRAHLIATPPTLAAALPGSTVSAALEKLVEKALAKAPTDRYQSARAMLAALDALPAVPMRRPGGARDPSTMELDIDVEPVRRRAEAGRGTTRWAILAALVGCVAAFLLGVRWAGSDTETPSALPDERALAELREAASAAGASVATGVASGVEAVAAHAASVLPTTIGDDPATDIADPALEGEGSEAGAEGDPLAAEDVADLGADGESTPEAEDGDILADPTGPASTGDGVGFEVPATRPRARNPWAGGRIPALLVRLHRTLERRDLSRLELRQITRYRNEHTSDPRVRLLLGHAFVRRGWLTAALDQYERALSLDLGTRGDPDLLPTLVRIARSETLTGRASAIVDAAYAGDATAVVDRAIARETNEANRARLTSLRTRVAGH